MKNDLGIYVHIPFCEKKCDYCDFASRIGGDDLFHAYAEALNTELLSYEKLWNSRPIETLYLGGGTPSAYPLEFLQRALHPLLDHLQDHTEFTIEVNPESVTERKAQAWKRMGVNRISMGVQSTDPVMLRHLGRLHSREKVFESYEILRHYFTNINLDIIYALRDHDETYLQTTEELLRLKPQHLSTYALELYEHLPLYQKQPPAGEDASFEQFHHIRQLVEQAGFDRYEISNFATEGHVSRHNLRYWRRQDTLGLGLSAHGLIGSIRTANPTSMKSYLSDPLRPQKEHLTTEDEAFEVWMLGLRTREGVDRTAFAASFPDVSVEQAIDRNICLGNLAVQGDRVHCTIQGFDLLNHVLMDFMK